GDGVSLVEPQDIIGEAADSGEDAGIFANTRGVLAQRNVADMVRAVVSRPEGFHLRPLPERCGSLSTHTAPIKRACQPPFRQCTNRSGCLSAMLSRKRLARILWPFNRLYFLIAQATNVLSKCLRTGYIADG